MNPTSMSTIPWQEMTWLNPPERADFLGDVLEVVTRPMTDFWRTTAYGFVHDDGHFLGAPMAGDRAIEVTFRGEFAAPWTLHSPPRRGSVWPLIRTAAC